MVAVRRNAGALAAVLIAAAGSYAVVSAQRGRGGATAAPRHTNSADSSYLRMPLPAGEEAYTSLDGARMKTFVEDIAAISRTSRDQGIKYWGRIAGTQTDKDTEDYIAKRFREFGLTDVRIASGDMGQIQTVRPAFQLITSPLYYHSDHDLPVDVPPAGLEAVARAYAKIITQTGSLARAELEDNAR